MKKIINILFCLTLVLIMTGCSINFKIEKDSTRFEREYESYNSKKNSSGVEFRSVSIESNNPFIYISAEDIVKKINKQETFYLYIGDKQCPWCRSSIESAIKIAKKNKIDKIYYVYIWDNDHNEILRDKYVLENGQPKLEIKGTDAYYDLLDKFDKVLADYTLTDENKKVVNVNEKRIYAPNYFYIKDGKVEKFITGIAESQKSPNAELTDKIIEEQEKQFNELFGN